MPKKATKFLYPKQGGGWIITIPQWRDHPLKVLIRLFNKNSKNIKLNILNDEEKAMLIEFFEEIERKCKFGI